MITTLIGKKIAQTQQYTSEGKRIPVTQITVGPSVVVQIKNKKSDGYWALQIGFDQKKKVVGKALSGHLKKSGHGNWTPRFLQEIRLHDLTTQEDIPFKVGDSLPVDQIFKEGDVIKVTGITKSKGFQGGVKRHGFKGGPRTHGQSDRERAPGSIGQTTTPGRVYKGKRMAGRMGGIKMTIKGLKVVSIEPQTQMLTVKGLVPGSISSHVLIQKQ